MDALIKGAVEKLVNIAGDFHRVHKSEVVLLKESGYFELYDRIGENEIMKVLKMHSHLIAEWVQFSEDSRSSDRWGFIRHEDGRCFVGHWPDGKDFEEISTMDEFYACAAFIKRHAESIRSRWDKS